MDFENFMNVFFIVLLIVLRVLGISDCVIVMLFFISSFLVFGWDLLIFVKNMLSYIKYL